MPSEIEPIYQFHDDCEKRVYVSWININLYNNTNNIGNHFPLNPHSEEIFDKINDGLIFCYIIHLIFPDAIDITIISQAPHMSKREKAKNLQLAYETARSYGCALLDIELNHIFCGVRQSVLEFFWQIFLVGLVKSIKFISNPEILILRHPGEALDTIKTMKPEQILMRYVNYTIHKSNPGGCRMGNFKDDLNDGKIYMYLLDSLAQQNDIELKHPLDTLLGESDPKLRYEMLSENFDSLKLHGFLIENLMEAGCKDQACYKMHLLTVASIFHKFPLSTTDSAKLALINDQIKLEQESHLETLCRIFLNFLGVDPPCCHLLHDCKDSLLIAEVMDKFCPDIFSKYTFITDFTEGQFVSEKIHNASICLNKLDKFISCPITNLHPEYIQDGNRDVITEIIFNLILYWVCYDKQTGKKYDKKDLLSWINGFNSKYNLTSFRDSDINEKRILADVINNVFPESINWGYFDKLKSTKDRAIYCISVARREGCPMFISPPMLAVSDYRCVILAFAILKHKSPKKDKTCL